MQTDRRLTKAEMSVEWLRLKTMVDKLDKAFQSMESYEPPSDDELPRLKNEVAKLSNEVATAEKRIADVKAVLLRYGASEDPVIASDGYTYERRVMLGYYENCAKSGIVPASQQTQETLDPTILYSNRSLVRFIEILKAEAVPQSSSVRAPPPPPAYPGSANALRPTAPSYNAAVVGSLSATTPDATTMQLPTMIAGNYWPEGFFPTAAGVPYLQGQSGKYHPCVRVYGHCNYGDTCVFAKYPSMTCLTYLKGKCRFGEKCHELHPRN